MPDPRNHGHGNGPVRVPSYGHQYGDLHDRIVGDETPDETFYSKVSNKQKVEFICRAIRVPEATFHLDLPLPLEDWAMSEDNSLLNAGLFFADMRRQFYESLLNEHTNLRDSPAFGNHAEAEFWNFEFNRLITKRQQGFLLGDPRVLN